jgi:hypothetical protein
MKKMLLGLGMMALASLGLFAQTNNANAFLLGDRSPNVTVGQIIAGGGMAAVMITQTCNSNLSHCAKFGSGRWLKWYGLTTVGCLGLTPIIAGGLVSMNEHRELRSSEAFIIAADCVVPIIGGLIMKAAFDANPQWDAGTGLPSKR